jgi:hypothetical protein
VIWFGGSQAHDPQPHHSKAQFATHIGKTLSESPVFFLAKMDATLTSCHRKINRLRYLQIINYYHIISEKYIRNIGVDKNDKIKSKSRYSFQKIIR